MWSSSWVFPFFCVFFLPFLFFETSFLCEWTISVCEVELCVSFLVDSFSLVFFFTVSLVSFSVFLYSLSYMQNDGFKKKFIIGMVFFMISMVLLVFSSNLFWVMVGWDGLGLTSFFLILFFQNWKSMNSAMITFLTNRIGDSFFLLTLVWAVNLSQWDYFYIPLFGKLLFLFGAFSKSAQLPFSAWLPLAMAAPTPVSSLVHSSTLVTAGVFLLIRFKEAFNDVSLVTQIFSFLTIFLAGLSSIGETDLKKIVALSTLSHIGLMILSISLGMFSGAFVHLILHAFFKSLLFMISGIVIHINSGNQDVRKIGLLGFSFTTSCSLFVSLASMVGAPFLSGFVSKEILYSYFMVSGSLVFLFWISVFLTGLYSFRLALYLFSNFSVSVLSVCAHLESLVFYFMSVFAVCGGVMVKSISLPLEFSQLSGPFQPFSFSEAKTFLFVFLFFGIFLGVACSPYFSRLKLSFFFHEMMFVLFFSLFLQSSVIKFSWLTMFKVFTKGTKEAVILFFINHLGKTAKLNFQLLNTLFIFEEIGLVFLTCLLANWSWNILFRMESIFLDKSNN